MEKKINCNCPTCAKNSKDPNFRLCPFCLLPQVEMRKNGDGFCVNCMKIVLREFTPCPFCGVKPKTQRAHAQGVHKGKSRAFHDCEVLGFIELTDWTNDLIPVIKKWNTRVQP